MKLLLGLVVGMFLSSSDIADRPTPGKAIIALTQDAIEAHTDADSLGQYYTLQFDLPQSLDSNTLEHVLLEFYADVDVKSRNGVFDETPVLEVFALREPFDAGIQSESLDFETKVSRPIAVGERRHVVFDITSIVRAHLGGTLENNGLVVGSISGLRDGNVTIRAGQLAGSAVAQVRIYSTVW